MEKLQKWLEEKCNEQNLSWREASLRMGLNAGFVSAVMGGQVPGLESCKAIANFFHVSPVLILQMAGHIENIPNSPILDPRLQYLISMWPLLPGYAHDIFIRQVQAMEIYNDDLRRAMAAAGMDVPPRPPKEE